MLLITWTLNYLSVSLCQGLIANITSFFSPKIYLRAVAICVKSLLHTWFWLMHRIVDSRLFHLLIVTITISFGSCHTITSPYSCIFSVIFNHRCLFMLALYFVLIMPICSLLWYLNLNRGLNGWKKSNLMEGVDNWCCLIAAELMNQI